MRPDSKCSDGSIILPWSGGKPLAWDVTVPDTYAEVHVANSTRQAGAAASLAAKVTKYDQLTKTHVFYPVTIEMAGTAHHKAIELVEDIGKCTSNVTGNPRERAYLFQQLSVALQRGNMVSFQSTFAAS